MHGDIKPANICIKYNENMRNKYEFTLIDFGIMTKFKLNKVQNRYSQPIGNLLFNSLRGLMCEQTRFQDDYESLIFLAYSFIFDNVPWQTDKAIYKNQAQYNNKQVTNKTFIKTRIAKYEEYNRQMIANVQNYVLDDNPSTENPFAAIFSFLATFNKDQDNQIKSYLMQRKQASNVQEIKQLK